MIFSLYVIRGLLFSVLLQPSISLWTIRTLTQGLSGGVLWGRAPGRDAWVPWAVRWDLYGLNLFWKSNGCWIHLENLEAFRSLSLSLRPLFICLCGVVQVPHLLYNGVWVCLVYQVVSAWMTVPKVSWQSTATTWYILFSSPLSLLNVVAYRHIRNWQQEP